MADRRTFLVGIKGLMIGVETPGEIPPRQRLAVEGQLGPILIGILLRRGEATDLTFRERRERIEGEGLIAIVHLAHQILAEKVGIGVLEADQMAFGAGDTVGIEPVGGIRFAAAGDRGHVLPEPQTVVIIALAFIILGDQLQLAVIIDLNRPRPHHVEAVRVLEPRLGIIEDQRIVIAVVPAAETLIGYRQAAGCVVCSAADGRRDALIMIVAVRKTALAAHLEIDLTILLPLFGNDVDKPAGTAPAVQRGRSGDHFDMFDVEWIDGVELAAVGA